MATDVKADAGEKSVTHAERHGHHGRGDYHGRGFAFGRLGLGLGHLIHEQMRAARREVASEQLGEAVADLTARVAEVFETAGQVDDLDAAQENFAATVQDVVDRFDSGEIGRRSAVAGFRAAFEDLVEAVRTGSAGVQQVTQVDQSGEVDAGVIPAAQVAASAGEASDTGEGSLVESLGQVFNAFMQGLRADWAALGDMRSFVSQENRDVILDAFVGLYRELAGLHSGETDVNAGGADVDQLV